MDTLVFGLIGILFVWLIAVSYLFFQMRNQYAVITRGGEKRSLMSILESLTQESEKSLGEITKLSKRCDIIEQKGKGHIQKVGLLRFNPFKDTGGDQSFILSLVDEHESGVVISGLYSRNGTRWYAKQVKSGKGTEYDLSEEEQKALKLAKS